MAEKAVLFDMMGVIIKEGHLIRDTLSPMVNKPFEETKALYMQYKVGEISRDEFWKKLDVEDIDTMEKTFLDILHLNDNAAEAFIYLKKKYDIAILSDLPTDWIEYLVKKFDLNAYFSVIEYSGKSKLSKKQPEAFEEILKLLGKEPQNAYHIDDQPNYLNTASKLGIKTILVETGKWPCQTCTADFTIRGLAELKDIL